MKLFKSTWLVGSMAAGMLAMSAPAAVAGIAGSQHDFTTTGGAQQKATGSAEICAFCHTPHAADESFVGAPLWNKSYSGVEGDFTRYSVLGTSTLDGDEADVGSVSLACLSCHDGSQAMDVVVNAPGQDLNSGELFAGAIGAMTSTGTNSVALLGQDLRDDHPVSIEYGGGTSGAVAWPTTAGTFCGPGQCGDPDFKQVTGISKNSQIIWFFDDNTNGRVDKEEVRLYARSDSGNEANVPYVECGSCHDPHNTRNNYGGDTDGGAGADGSVVDFLRKSNDNSAICLTCHDK